MGKGSVVVMLLSLLVMVVAMPLAQCLVNEAKQTNNWREIIGVGEEKVTKLHFYFHDTVSGNKPSAVRVAQGADTDKSPTLFGVVMMADDPLTEGPEPTSKLVGRAQGIYGSAGQDELGLIMAINYGFTDGIYNGSAFSVLGRNPAMHLVRELPIVGGGGIFRLARGFAVAKTYSVNNLGDAIVEYNVTIVHY